MVMDIGIGRTARAARAARAARVVMKLKVKVGVLKGETGQKALKDAQRSCVECELGREEMARVANVGGIKLSYDQRS